MKNHTRKSKASGSTHAKITEILTRSGRYSRKALVDKATGYQEEIMAEWCDWVTVNHWGVEAAVIPINKGEDCTVGASSKQNETQAKYKGKAQ